MNIKDMVSNGKKVNFIRYQDGEMWYATECGFEFPIPAEDLKGATFLAQDKAMLFLRWINKHSKMLDSAKSSQ